MNRALASAGLFALGLGVVLVLAAMHTWQASPTASVAIPPGTPAQVQVHLSTQAGAIWPTANYGPNYGTPDDSTPIPRTPIPTPTPSDILSCPANGPLIDHYTLTTDRFGAPTCCPHYVSDKYVPIAGPACIPPTRIRGQ